MSLIMPGSGIQGRPPTEEEMNAYELGKARIDKLNIGRKTPLPTPTPPLGGFTVTNGFIDPNNGPKLPENLARSFTPEYFQGLRNALGTSPEVAAPQAIAPMFASQAPKPIEGLGNDYYTAQREQMKEALRQEFFGPLGTVQQTASGESAAGRLGSGVGKQVIAESALRPFAQGSAAIDQNVLQAQLQEQAQVRQFNADQQSKFQGIMATLASADSSNALDAAKANASIRSDYNKLLGTLADAEAGRLSQEAIAQLDADVRLWEAASKERSATAANETDRLNAQINYLNSLGQYKPVSGGPSGDVAGNLAGSFGVPTNQYAPQQTTYQQRTNATPPTYRGYRDGELSQDGNFRWSTERRSWFAI